MEGRWASQSGLQFPPQAAHESRASKTKRSQEFSLAWPLLTRLLKSLYRTSIPETAATVLLGECTHGTEEFYQIRAECLRPAGFEIYGAVMKS